MLPLVRQVIRDLAGDGDSLLDKVRIADSTPVYCARSRPAAGRSEMDGWACTPAGIPILWALADPKIRESGVPAATLDVEPVLAAARPGLTAEKGFVGCETEAGTAARHIT